MSSKIYCIAEMCAKTGFEAELLAKLIALEPLTLREDGCIRYRVTKQLAHSQAPTQSKFNLVFNEEWANLEAFEKHCQQPYIIEFFTKYVEDPATAIVEDCQVRIFTDELA
ncbi:MAG: hypothetical protein RLZZ293_1278 [Pseudomonadota bacterium]